MNATNNPQKNAVQLLTEDLAATDVPGAILPGDRVSIPITPEAVRAVRVLNKTDGLSRLQLIGKNQGYPSMASRMKYLVNLGANAVLLADQADGFRRPPSTAKIHKPK